MSVVSQATGTSGATRAGTLGATRAGTPAHAARPRDRTWIVAVAAAAWGLDGVFRQPLASRLDAATVVLWEHLIVVVVMAWFVPSAVRAFLRCRPRDRIAIVLIGAGASATATALFTKAFALASSTQDFITPLVLQKLQPLFAVTLAVVLLRERLRARFAVYAIPALAGAWLLSFPQPLQIQVKALEVAALAVGAAVLWGAGTVLGRLVSDSVTPRELTTLRYLWGLPAAALITAATGANFAPGGTDVVPLILLALIPGLAALSLYYVGLRTTAASRATFAELAFPATSALVGVTVLHSSLTGSQWVGMAIVVMAIFALGWNERGRAPVVLPPQPLP